MIEQEIKYNNNMHKSMRITDGIFQTNIKLFVMVNPKTYVNWNSKIIYGCYFLINDIQML